MKEKTFHSMAALYKLDAFEGVIIEMAFVTVDSQYESPPVYTSSPIMRAGSKILQPRCNREDMADMLLLPKEARRPFRHYCARRLEIEAFQLQIDGFSSIFKSRNLGSTYRQRNFDSLVRPKSPEIETRVVSSPALLPLFVS